MSGPAGPGSAVAPGEPRIVVLADAAAVADAAADHVMAGLRAAIEDRGVAHLALTGGSSAPPLYERLVSPDHRAAVNWSRVHLWWGDERLVPRDHPASNAGLAAAILLEAAARSGEAHDGTAGTDVEAGLRAGLELPVTNVHPWPVELAISRGDGGAEAAKAYAADLRHWLPSARGAGPALDMLLLGVGPDAHVLSAFPGSLALADDAPITMAVPAPTHVEPHLPRLTLTLPMVIAARSILVLASGAAKRDMLRDVLDGPRDLRRLPAQAARRPSAAWLLDREAAAGLRSVKDGAERP